jgi:cysteine-rich repeat protein
MFRNITCILVPLGALLAISGCNDLGDPAMCAGGLVCPSGTICAAHQDICIATPCGNGIIDVRAAEVCDDGNIIDGDGCSRDCLSDETCGNGVVDAIASEQCDPARNPAACDADCTVPICGDGFVNTAAGEECEEDGVQTATCEADCTRPKCGDQVVNLATGEICDAGWDTVTCDGDCTLPACGDGWRNAALDEPCDTAGNSLSCDADCTPPVCGDLLVNSAAGEECDTGETDASCDVDCTLPACGDGFFNPAAGEQCDVGGTGASCDVDCTLPVCGDGFFNPAAGEQCDDGNLIDTDECTATCELASCTDGLLNANETDVDCGGQCGATCEALASCSTSQDCAAPGVCLAGTCVPDARRLATGSSHTCAVLDTGAVRCWGAAGSGRLGYANTNHIGDDETPASVGDVTVGGTVVQVAASNSHTCALLATGAVRCWGSGILGNLGYANGNTIGDNETPASAGDVPVGGTVVQIAAGREHTCALLDTGAIRCWGNDLGGRLGYANGNVIGDNETPASAGDVAVGGTVVQIAAGDAHTCALLDTGAVRCWGRGYSGRLGYGNTNNIGDNETPTSVGDVPVGGTVVQIAAGGEHTCAVLDTGAVRCWGYGFLGRLGYANNDDIGDDETPASVGDVPVGGTVVQIAAGSQHTCAVLDTGAVRCWGHGSNGMLGYGHQASIGDNETPASAGNVNLGGTAVQIAAGGGHTCARLDTGAIRCWGYGFYGQLGYGNQTSIGDNEHPVSAGDVPYL